MTTSKDHSCMPCHNQERSFLYALPLLVKIFLVCITITSEDLSCMHYHYQRRSFLNALPQPVKIIPVCITTTRKDHSCMHYHYQCRSFLSFPFRCGNVAAILALDEHLQRDFTIFEAAPQVRQQVKKQRKKQKLYYGEKKIQKQ